MNHNTKVYGISGVARAGKDTFASTLVKIITDDLDQQCQILSFANALKADMDSFLLDKVGVSAFTQDTEEKHLIRPLLVAYGMTMRNVKSDYWICKVQDQIDSNIQKGVVSLVTDVRFTNEINVIKKYPNSCVIHISRLGKDGNIKEPANLEERENDPKCRALSDKCLTWPTFRDDQKEYVDFVKKNFLALS